MMEEENASVAGGSAGEGNEEVKALKKKVDLLEKQLQGMSLVKMMARDCSHRLNPQAKETGAIMSEAFSNLEMGTLFSKNSYFSLYLPSKS